MKTKKQISEETGSHLVVGTTWTRSFVETVAKLNKEIGEAKDIRVGELYGNIPGDVLGTARSIERLHDCDSGTFSEHLKMCHDNGMQVIYTINSNCAGSSNELDSKLDQLFARIEELIKGGVDGVIMANPLFIEQTRLRFPNLRLDVSTVAHVYSLKAATYYAEQGVQRIILPMDANRDFRFLDALQKIEGMEYELLMTDACIYDCNYKQNHFALQSHDSVDCRRPDLSDVVKNYPFDRCWGKHIQNWPAEFLKSRWIRPEDMAIYENHGFNIFKISGRTMPEEYILRSVKGYLAREHKGNFLDVLPIIPGDADEEGKTQLNLPNEKLQGFLDHFEKHGHKCRYLCETSCTFCDDYAKDIKEESR